MFVGKRDIQHDRKCRSLAGFTLTVDGSVHQFDHLFRDRQAQPRTLDTVDTAVRLSGKGLIHLCHKFRTHSHARIRDDIGQFNTSVSFTRIFTHSHSDLALRLSILDSIGQNININLIQTKLIRIEIFFLHPVDAEAEINVFLFDHWL